jgi:hypothetical protein
MAVRRIFAANARQNHITSARIARNTKNLKKQANADTVIQRSFSHHLLSNLHSETFADSKNALS